ncbi:MAG: SpoIVB peptidase [Hungatella sp.]
MTRRQKFRRYLKWTFWGSVVFTIGFTYYYMETSIPDQINVVVNEEESFPIRLPFQTMASSESETVVLGNGSDIPSDRIRIFQNTPLTICGLKEGSYQVGLKAFGWLRLKEIRVDVVNHDYAIPCGTPIGIYLKSNGVMVIGTGQITNRDGMLVEPAFGILKSGDYIETINGARLNDKEELVDAVDHLDGEEAVLQIRRGEEKLEVKLDPVSTEDGDYKLGVWVRSDTQGIGTMTYLDLNGKFGALGHGISDSDTGSVVEIADGNLYETEILGIEKGTMGKPGVMSGVIYYGPSSTLGTIASNTEEGIFGTVNDKFKKKVHSQAVEIAYRQDVRKGAATLRSGVSGEIKDYEIEILKVDYSTIHQNKSLVIKVVDEELLNLTGGIVQGMSGSPILQDGKLIGAVTHVFIQDSTKGYGIFIENMLEAQGR